MVSSDKIKKAVLGLGTFFLDLIFPIECFGCGREGDWLCEECFKKMIFRPAVFCLHCRRSADFSGFCPDCRDFVFFDAGGAALDYDDKIAARLITALKYRGVRGSSTVLGDLLAVFFLKRKVAAGGGLDCFFANPLVMPVPLAAKRKRWRGFNQSELIARRFADNLGFEFSAGSLQRKIFRRAQVELGEEERKKNILGNFIFSGEPLADRAVILVDDVITTGATLNEAAKILKSGGAGKIFGLAAAKG